MLIFRPDSLRTKTIIQAFTSDPEIAVPSSGRREMTLKVEKSLLRRDRPEWRGTL